MIIIYIVPETRLYVKVRILEEFDDMAIIASDYIPISKGDNPLIRKVSKLSLYVLKNYYFNENNS